MFVTTFRDKIRKKLRVTLDPKSMMDLRLTVATQPNLALVGKEPV
ncbi:MAG: hypothetical protein Fur0022_13140 [Anaerolineales bacterium]